ncbi:MAG: hypothetical protein P8046_07515, partial [Anaerolineales bacterium]
KTSLAAEIAIRIGVPHIELDSLFWLEHWVSLDRETFRWKVSEALSPDQWVADGNYSSKVQDIVWGRAQVVLWLDYPFLLVLSRLLRRTFRRAFTRELLWGKNRESLLKAFFSRDSLILYFLRTYKKKREQYARLSVSPEFSHLQFFRLGSPQQAREWVNQFTSAP